MASPTEVTSERITQVLSSQEVIWQQDPEDQTILVPFVNMMFVIQINGGGILSVHGMWRGDLSEPEDRNKATDFVQEANARALVPKVYLAEDTEGGWKFHTESNTVVPAGLTDEQLEMFLGLSFQASLFSASQLQEALPHLVTWDEDSDADEPSEGEGK
ncbi:YbjN domain-containing protein [Actinomycetaceae bacterium TAE3-ERU4]|nr:YbjN domain-containing protein [Actinomycetaceae bacterium TAE3-ERU4]